jgi:hypothetical protein
MCHKPTRTEQDARRSTADARREHAEAPRPKPRTWPRGNPEPDRGDLERSTERLHAVLGR